MCLETDAVFERDAWSRGLTLRVILVILLMELLFLPVTIYTSFVTGIAPIVSAAAIVPLVMSLASSLYDVKFSVGEVFIAYSVLKAVIILLPPFYWLIYRSFFVNFPFLATFKLAGRSIQELVPTWITPPPSSPVHFLRTLIHPEWAIPIAVLASITALSFGADLVLAILFARLFIEEVEEELPFPFAKVDASLISTLAEERAETAKPFYVSLFIGLALTGIVYIPHMLGAPLIPLPWADFTMVTQYALPGAIVALASDPNLYVSGFVLPLSTVTLMLLGSLAIWCLGNYMTLTFFRDLTPEWVAEYYVGMNSATIYQRSFLRVWMGFQLGAMIGFPLAMLAIYGRELARLLKSVISAPRSGKPSPSRYLLALYLLFSLLSVLIFQLLVPEYPVYVSIAVSVGLSFLISFLVGRIVAEIGITPTFAWPWQAITYLTGYNGVAGWIFAPYVSLGGNALHINSIKVAYLTRTRVEDYIKGVTVGFLLSMIIGLVFIDLFWRLAPIPSAAYPFTIIYWPTLAMNDALFITRKITVKMPILLLGAITSAAALLAEVLLRRRGIILPAIAFVMGFFTLPPYTLAIFLGSLIGNLLVRRIVGYKRWMEIRDSLVAGFFAGSSIAIGLGIAATMLSKATWIWPW